MFPMVFCRWYNTAPLWGAVSLRLLCLALASFLSSPLPVCLSGTRHHMQWLWAVVPHVKSSAGKSESLGLMLCGLGVSQLCSLEWPFGRGKRARVCGTCVCLGVLLFACANSLIYIHHAERWDSCQSESEMHMCVCMAVVRLCVVGVISLLVFRHM